MVTCFGCVKLFKTFLKCSQNLCLMEKRTLIIIIFGVYIFFLCQPPSKTASPGDFESMKFDCISFRIDKTALEFVHSEYISVKDSK